MKNRKNHVQLVGRLGADPQVKKLENGSRLAQFSLAVINTGGGKKGAKTNVQWHAVTAWGELADLAEKILHKGVQVTIGGKLNIRSFVNKAGIKRSTTEIVAESLFVAQIQLALP